MADDKFLGLNGLSYYHEKNKEYISESIADMAIINKEDNEEVEIVEDVRDLVNKGWLEDIGGTKFAPRTLISQIQDNDGKLLSTYLSELGNGESSAYDYLPLSGGSISGDLAVSGSISEGGTALENKYATLDMISDDVTEDDIAAIVV